MITSYKSVEPAALQNRIAANNHAVAATYKAPEDSWALMLRPYTPRKVVSLSLARTQRILELHQRIAAKFNALPDAEWQREQNMAITKRAKLTREIRVLELQIARAERFSTFWDLKKKLRTAKDELCLFDHNMNGRDLALLQEVPVRFYYS
ncbi:MAG TPA: hypothetical protein VH255_04070 [Verrucomicrobiae bacterium]|nr:hypothetical protein [Verrucomicrobiae bacterium]